jgi:hypothetical protein
MLSLQINMTFSLYLTQVSIQLNVFLSVLCIMYFFNSVYNLTHSNMAILLISVTHKLKLSMLNEGPSALLVSMDPRITHEKMLTYYCKVLLRSPSRSAEGKLVSRKNRQFQHWHYTYLFLLQIILYLDEYTINLY